MNVKVSASVTEEVLKAQIKTICSIFLDGWDGGVDLHRHLDKPILLIRVRNSVNSIKEVFSLIICEVDDCIK